MIQADTIAHFYFDLNYVENHENTIKEYLNSLKHPLKTEEIIRIGTPFMSNEGLTVRVSAKFKLFIEVRNSCKHLDDYVSFIFPTIKSNIAGELISTQNLYLQYIRDKKLNHQKKINWEELATHWND